MKKVLFIMNNLHCGGAEKALVSLLGEMDFSKYEVDLHLFSHEGLFMDQIPKEVNLLPEPKNYKYFDMSIKKAIVENAKSLRFGVIINRILAGFVYKNENIKSRQEQKVWRYLSNVIPKLDKQYDFAVGYLEKTPNYFCVDKVIAKRKIGFIHNDYNKLQMDAQIDRPYFEKLNHIFTISGQCETILKENFPSVQEKFSVMYNIVSPDTLQFMASEETDFNPKGFALVSVGRLNTQKGFDIAVDALKILTDKGLDLHWYILGEGEQRQMLEAKIKANGLEERFILLGIKENPYPYVKRADIYVQPSRFEGKSIAIDEAKILGKPIVVTDFPSIVDQVVHLKNGYITSIDAQSIADGIEALYRDKTLRETLSATLKNEKLGTQDEIEKLYREFKIK